jgi:hypothetical protein
MKVIFRAAFTNLYALLKDSIGCIAKIRNAKGEVSPFAFRALIIKKAALSAAFFSTEKFVQHKAL